MVDSVQIEERQVPAIPADLNRLHPVLARIYAGRGLSSDAELSRGLDQLLPDSDIKGVEAAVDRLVQALEQQQSVMILGDFDCDGATSTATTHLALSRFGFHKVDYLVPNRFEFGYGLSPEIVAVAAERQPQLIITVDNGISSIEGVAAANRLGIDVIVTDHHLPGDQLPEACAIVNPNQPDCDFVAKSTCGVGVVFYVMIALRRRLQQEGYFERRGMKAPNLGELLDLVALGTVADVVPLEANNRTLVYQGLERIRRRRARPGLLALLEVAGRQPERISASDLGFAVAPRLNAAGRLDDMSLGIECLLTNDPERALELARELDQMNRDRRGIEQQMQRDALDALEQLGLDESQMPTGLAIFDENFHQGVIGILASRLKERFHRPVIVFAPGDEGEIKGSARSIPGFHIRDGLDAIAAKNPGLIAKFGGHAMAAGLTIKAADFERFCQLFDQQVEQVMAPEDLQRSLLTDGQLAPCDFTLDLAQLLRDAGPWGHQFPEPSFHGEFRLLQQRIVGQRHLKMVLQEPQTGLALDAIAFNVDTETWPDTNIQRVHLVYKLDVNEFRGQRNLQLLVDWLEPA
ncbi:MAG: single-stranded-DNA-specific exonuclease RecJ [Oceanospirillaceae bacterium]|nr:single-stranded-DNA-specific exonuclease RecJ [Oceanospirillaceae bacterium]